MSKLAMDGGDKACPQPLPSWPHYAQDEIDAVADLLSSGKVNQWSGPTVKEFEGAASQVFGQPYGVAVTNGTLALELALVAAGVGPGDEVIVTPRSFVASASCVVMRGATPVFADVDALSQNITAETIKVVISPRTKAIIPVHLNGWPCDMPAIMDLAAQHKLYVIEDCAQAHGAKINGQSIGSFGHAAAFSFCQDKIMSTGGEGGMTLFRDEADWRRAWAFKDHGKSFDTVFNTQHPPGFRWLHESFGTNWRMLGMQAAIGLVQLKKLPDWNARRRTNAAQLTQSLEKFEAISVPQPVDNFEHAFYRMSFHVDPEGLAAGWSREKIMQAIWAEGVPCLEVCSEMYREKAFDDFEFPAPDCPVAIELGKKVCVMQVHPTYDEQALAGIRAAIDKVLSVAVAENHA